MACATPLLTSSKSPPGGDGGATPTSASSTGAAIGLVVIDVDPKHGGETSVRQLHRDCPLPHRSGRQWHWPSPLLRLLRPVPSSIGRLGPGVDVRGDGSYNALVALAATVIVAPPSRQSGRSYRSIVVTEIATLPSELSTRIAPPRLSRSPKCARRCQHHGLRPCSTRRRGRAVATAPEGQRNRTLYRAASKLGQLTTADLLDGPLISDRLLTAATESDLPHPEAHRTIASGLRTGIRIPRRPTIEEAAIELH
jgi:hypothetical protein